jgi:hypothetical protein
MLTPPGRPNATKRVDDGFAALSYNVTYVPGAHQPGDKVMVTVIRVGENHLPGQAEVRK